MEQHARLSPAELWVGYFSWVLREGRREPGGRARRVEQGIQAEGLRQEGDGVAGMSRAKGRTWAPGCRGDSPQSARCVGTAPGPRQRRGTAARKHILPALEVPAKRRLTAGLPDNLPRGRELAAPTPFPPGSLIPIRPTDEQRGQTADCVGPLQVPGGHRLGDAVTVGQSGRAGLRLTLAEDGGTLEVRGPHLTGLRGAELRTLWSRPLGTLWVSAPDLQACS